MIDNKQLDRIVVEALEAALKERGMVNILVAGRSGVGKSTLINAIFQGDLAATGMGRPVTRNVREIKKEGVPVTVIDTRGLELADFEETLEELEAEIRKRKDDPDPSRHVHVGWICLAEDMRRVEQAETDLARMLSRYFPLAAVITKARSDQGFKDEVLRLLPDVKNVVRVRAIPETLDDGHELSPMGLVDLIRLTQEMAPEGQRNALAAAQKVDVSLKKSRAQKLVIASSAAAAGIAASPIPFADAALLIPAQVGMLAGVSAVFGLSITRGFLATLIAAAGGSAATTYAGRAVVANLIKLVPGAGTAVGSVISAATASAFTALLGEAYIAALAGLFDKSAGETPAETEILEAFKKELSRKTPAPEDV